MEKKIRVVIVDDMVLACKMVKALLETDPQIEVVATAKNGEQGVEIVAKIKPNVVIMDLKMPVMDGFTATRYIMAQTPTPILILSTPRIIDETNAAFNSLKIGALDVMEKPDGAGTNDLKEIGKELVAKVKLFSRVKVIRHILSPQQNLKKVSISKGFYKILAIGASTGGPRAILEVLENLPTPFPIPIVIVQHISVGFTLGFANWLEQSLSLKVTIAKDQEQLQAGTVYIAPDKNHLTIKSNLSCHLDSSIETTHIPSVDILFSSIARNFKEQAIAVLLTGMGDDGARGLKEVFANGGQAYAQDEESSIVFGMPGQAIKLGAAREILPPKKIAKKIISLVFKQKGNYYG